MIDGQLVGKLKEQWMVDYALPDPDFKQRIQGTKELKEEGCTKFSVHRYYDIASDLERERLMGYVVDTKE